MSNCDVAVKDATAGQQPSRCKNDRVHLAQVVNCHDHSASAAAHGYAAPTIASQLRMKLSGLAATSPCQRYKSAEPFLPVCHRRDTSKTTTAKPSHGKCSTKKVTIENNVPKLSERAVRVHPPSKAPSSGNERLSETHHHLQNNRLKNANENQPFSSAASNSQLKDLNRDKGTSKQKVQQLAKVSSARKVSAARRPDEKSKEVLRGTPPKLNQTKRTTVGKMTQSRAAPELSRTSNMKKDPLFEQMVEEEQYRWLTEVKEIEDKRKECYCINENLRINFKVEWISCSKGAAPTPTDALDSTSQHMESRNKDFTENLDVEVNTGKSQDRKINEEVIDGSGVIWETSIVEGVLVDAYRLLCKETSVGDAEQLSHKETFVEKTENSGDKIVREASVEEAGTADFKLNSQPEGGHGDTEETESENNYFVANSVAEMEPSWLDGNYDEKSTGGQKSSLTADSCRLRDGKSAELEASSTQLVIGMSQVGSGTDGFEVKCEIEKLPEETTKAVCTDNKGMLEGSVVAAESENAADCMARDVSLQKAEANNFASDAETLVPNVESGYKVFCDATEKDDTKDIVLQLSDVELERGAFEGKSDTVVIRGDAGMGDVEEILEKQQVTVDANGQTGFERKDDEMNNYVFEDLHPLVNGKGNLYSGILQTQSEEGFYETENSKMPIHVIKGPEQNASASQIEIETGSGSLSAECTSYGDQNLRHMCHSSGRDVNFQESLEMSKGKVKSCQEDVVMQSKSAPRELDNIRNETDVQMSFQRKSNTTGSRDSKGFQGLESNVSCDASGLTRGFGKNPKQNLTIKENQKNVKKERAASSNIPYDCDMDDDDLSMEDDDECGFNATVAVRDGTSARHSTTVDVVCLEVGSGRTSVNPLMTFIGDSISA